LDRKEHGVHPRFAQGQVSVTIYIIAAVSFLLHVGFGGGKVTVSLFAIDRGASLATIGILMSLMGLLPTLLAVAFGRLTDRIGVRTPTIAGCIGVTVGLLLPALVPSLATLFVAVVLLGTSFTCYQVAITNFVGAMGGVAERTRNYSILSMGFAGASFLGPLIAGFSIDGIGHRWTFPLLAAWTLAPGIILLTGKHLLPNIKVKHGEKKHGRIIELMRDPKLRNTFITGGILSAAWDLYQFLLPLYGHSIGLSASMIGIVLSSFAVAIFVVRAFIPVLSGRYGEVRLISAAIFIAGLSFLIFAFSQSVWLLALASIVLGLGVGCGQPLSLTLIYNLSPPGRQGEATGVRVSVNHMTHIVVPLFFGSMGTAMGFMPIFLISAGLMGVCGVVSRRTFMK
jgi:MFS family permease